MLVSVPVLVVSVPVVDEMVVDASVPVVDETVVLVSVPVNVVPVTVVAVVVSGTWHAGSDNCKPASKGLYPFDRDSAVATLRVVALYVNAPENTGSVSGPAKNFHRGERTIASFAT